MKSSAKHNIELLASLYECIEMRKLAEKREKELKDQLRAVMVHDPVLEAGNFVALVISRQRTSLNTDALKDYLGPKIVKFMVRSEYEIMEVRPIETLKK